MAIKKYKPTSPGKRFQTGFDNKGIAKTEPKESLTVSLKKHGGRNNTGRVTSWHRGGGNKRQYRLIDFKRDKFGVPSVVVTIERDPNRSSMIALLKYLDGEYRYIIAPQDVKIGDTLMSGPDSEIKAGNAMTIETIPVGTMIHNIELKPGQGAKLVRGAGMAAQLLAKEAKYAQIKLPSGEVRRVLINCMATIGQVGNTEHENISYGKAGRIRHLGRKPIVRGVAMNPVDHPLGGGEGRSSGGRPACTPWGKPEGIKTRRNKRTDKFIITKRK